MLCTAIHILNGNNLYQTTVLAYIAVAKIETAKCTNEIHISDKIIVQEWQNTEQHKKDENKLNFFNSTSCCWYKPLKC